MFPFILYLWVQMNADPDGSGSILLEIGPSFFFQNPNPNSVFSRVQSRDPDPLYPEPWIRTRFFKNPDQDPSFFKSITRFFSLYFRGSAPDPVLIQRDCSTTSYKSCSNNCGSKKDPFFSGSAF